MTRKGTKEKSNVVVERRVTRLQSKRRVTRQQSKANAATTHQVISVHSQESSFSPSKYKSRKTKVVPNRCASLRSTKRFKETEENVNDSKMAKSVDESIPMTEDAQKLPHQVQESEHDSTSNFSSELNAALGNLFMIFSPAPVDSPAAPSKYSSQHAKMNPSTSTPVMMGAGIVEHNDIMRAGTIDRGIQIPTTKEASNIEEITLKQMTQNQKFEDCHPPPSVPNGDLNPAAATTTVSNIIGVQRPLGEATLASNVIEERPEESANNPNHSIGLTELANMWVDDASSQDEVGFFACNSLVTIQGYRVNEASAPILRNILEKHGDIAMNCIFTRVENRSFLLETICEIIRTLQNTNFAHLTQVEIQKMLGHVDDCRKTGVEVGWLHERFNEIMEAKQLVKHSSILKETRNRNNQVIEETRRDLEELKEKMSLTMEKLKAAQGEDEKIRETVSVAKAKVSCFITRSLVDGLL